jgi:hypothetical protein
MRTSASEDRRRTGSRLSPRRLYREMSFRADDDQLEKAMSRQEPRNLRETKKISRRFHISIFWQPHLLMFHLRRLEVSLLGLPGYRKDDNQLKNTLLSLGSQGKK